MNFAVVSGSGSLVKIGTGMLTLWGTNTYSGGTTVGGGILQLGDGTALNGYVQGDITNNAALVFANPLGQAYGGVVSGSGGLTKTGAGTLTLTGLSTYGGNTAISNGTVQLGVDGALPAAGMLLVDTAGTLDIASFKQTVGKQI